MSSYIEVFRTTLVTAADITKLRRRLLARWPSYRLAFDLDDCDKILRIQSGRKPIEPHQVIAEAAQLGYGCEVLPD